MSVECACTSAVRIVSAFLQYGLQAACSRCLPCIFLAAADQLPRDMKRGISRTILFQFCYSSASIFLSLTIIALYMHTRQAIFTLLHHVTFISPYFLLHSLMGNCSCWAFFHVDYWQSRLATCRTQSRNSLPDSDAADTVVSAQQFLMNSAEQRILEAFSGPDMLEEVAALLSELLWSFHS